MSMANKTLMLQISEVSPNKGAFSLWIEFLKKVDSETRQRYARKN